MNHKLNEALGLVRDYERRYNTAFEVSGLYSLFPKEGEYGFTQSWPFLDDGGVYLILNDLKEVIYVGKADVFGHRLYDHFHGSKECVICEPGWKSKPAYVVNIKVPADRLYENLSLEGFLIKELDPEDNTRGRYGH